MTDDTEKPTGTNANAVTHGRNDNHLWLAMWRNKQTDEFHQTATNPLLTQLWHSQKLKKGSRILVPLCGKSLDMLWLAAQGYQVIGVELSPVAVKAFFKENRLKVKKRRNGNFTCWQSGDIAIWCGDFFSLLKPQLGRIDSVFDRAALTALPAAARGYYATQLRALIGEKADVFLLTTEDIVEGSGESPVKVDSTLSALYQDFFDIELIHSQHAECSPGAPPGGAFDSYHKAYLLHQRLLDTADL